MLQKKTYPLAPPLIQTAGYEPRSRSKPYGYVPHLRSKPYVCAIKYYGGT